jgi:hypothetical protein
MKSANPGMPAQLIDPMIEKLKKGAELTDDFQFNTDGSGNYCATGQEALPITWRLVHKSGAMWFMELNMKPDDKSSVKIVFKGADKFSMSWLDDGGGNEGDLVAVYNRLR